MSFVVPGARVATRAMESSGRARGDRSATDRRTLPPMDTASEAGTRRTVRALHDADTIRIYQAYSREIAAPALECGTFASPPFKRERMTWIKPSFTWMAYRSGWGRKDAGQAVVLGIDVSREGFEWALAHSCPSHRRPGEHADEEAFRAALRASPVRVQWDPERDVRLEPVPGLRAIQVGLRGEAVERYVDEWIVRLEDVTPLVHRIEAETVAGRLDEARALLPDETPYPLPELLRERVGADRLDDG